MIYIYKILLILFLAYIGLTLYFEHRLDKQNKEWLKKQKHTQNLKKN